MIPGEIVFGPGRLTVNAGRRTVELTVRNTSDHVVHVTSHYHFFEANRRLAFDRGLAYGMRLDVASGAGVRWGPGEVRRVRLVELVGSRHVWGFNGLVDGPIDPHRRAEALRRAIDRGFLHEPEPGHAV